MLCSTYTGSGGRDLKGTKDKPKNVRTLFHCILSLNRLSVSFVRPLNPPTRHGKTILMKPLKNPLRNWTKMGSVVLFVLFVDTNSSLYMLRKLGKRPSGRLLYITKQSLRYRYDGLYTVEKAWMEPGLNPQGARRMQMLLKPTNWTAFRLQGLQICIQGE